MSKPRVIIESPLSGDFPRNQRYARLCAIDCARRGEAPYASHLLCTQFLNDADPEDRKLGMAIGSAWSEAGEKRAVYTDLGVSGGMSAGIEEARYQGQEIEYRTLPEELMARLDAPGPAYAETDGSRTTK